MAALAVAKNRAACFLSPFLRRLTPLMHQSAITLLLPEYRRRILGLLLLRPDEALHGREIARRVSLPAGTITRELVKLAGAELLRREKRGNQHVYSANTANPIFTELSGILRKTSGIADVLRHALAPVSPKLRSAFVFGSVAQGRESAGSDIDLMLIGNIGFAEAVGLLHPVQEALGREINPKVFGANEFAGRRAKEAFLRDVLKKPKIFLVGDADDLAELARPDA